MKKSLSIVLSAFVITTAFAQNKSENTVASRSFLPKVAERELPSLLTLIPVSANLPILDLKEE